VADRTPGPCLARGVGLRGIVHARTGRWLRVRRPLGNPGSAPKARVTYAAEYADPLGRSIASADWGTAGGSGWSRPATIPTSSDTILVSRTGYNSAGEAFQVFDPAGKEDRTDYDAAGRRTELIENYVDSSSGGSSGNGCAPSDDENVTTQFAYTPEGNLGEQKVIDAQTGDQITKFIYGTTLSDSEIASSQLLRRIEYPDSTGPTDSVQYSYNRQSDTIGLEDQNGNVHAYDYDLRGRRTQDRVTTLGSGVDGAVRRIATTYTPLDRVETITSYDAPGVGSGNGGAARGHRWTCGRGTARNKFRVSAGGPIGPLESRLQPVFPPRPPTPAPGRVTI
jgi:YD repeat-containing protein